MHIYALNLLVEHSGEHRWEQNNFCLFSKPQAFWQSSAPAALSTLVTSVVLCSLTGATMMIPGEDETHVCGYICYKFIHWALWRTLMRTKYFLFVHHTTSILAKLNTWCFEHSGDIGCSWLVNSSHTDESWEGRNTYLRIYTLLIYSLNTMENTGENKIFFVRSPHHKDFGKAQPWCFEHSGDTSCSWLVNSSHNDESWKGRNTCLRIYTLLIYSLSTLENTGENKIFFVRSPRHKHFGKAQHLLLWAFWWHQLFSTR